MLAQGGGEQGEGEEVTGVLRVPERGPDRETPTRSSWDRHGSAKEVPGLHVVRPLGVHSEPLPH